MHSSRKGRLPRATYPPARASPAHRSTSVPQEETVAQRSRGLVLSPRWGGTRDKAAAQAGEQAARSGCLPGAPMETTGIAAAPGTRASLGGPGRPRPWPLPAGRAERRLLEGRQGRRDEASTRLLNVRGQGRPWPPRSADRSSGRNGCLPLRRPPR